MDELEYYISEKYGFLYRRFSSGKYLFYDGASNKFVETFTNDSVKNVLNLKEISKENTEEYIYIHRKAII